jgi:hypothetical protein
MPGSQSTAPRNQCESAEMAAMQRLGVAEITLLSMTLDLFFFFGNKQQTTFTPTNNAQLRYSYRNRWLGGKNDSQKVSSSGPMLLGQ